MAFNPETATWETGIYQWETTDPLQGGLGGLDNIPMVQLGNRTKYLKAHVDALEAATTAFVTITPEATGDFTVPATNPGGEANYFQMRLNNKTNEVEFRGSVVKGTASGTASIAIYVLPIGKRPVKFKAFTVPQVGSNSTFTLYVSTTGLVSCQPTDSIMISLDSVRFSLD